MNNPCWRCHRTGYELIKVELIGTDSKGHHPIGNQAMLCHQCAEQFARTFCSYITNGYKRYPWIDYREKENGEINT